MPETANIGSPTRGLSYLYMTAAFVIVVAGMRAAESILNPLLLAIFLSVISAPAYFGLLKKGDSNWLALLIVIGVLSIVVLGVAYVVMGSIAGFTSRQDYYIDLIEERSDEIEVRVTKWIPDWAKPESREEDDASPDERGQSTGAIDELESATGEQPARSLAVSDVEPTEADDPPTATGAAITDEESTVAEADGKASKDSESDVDGTEASAEDDVLPTVIPETIPRGVSDLSPEAQGTLPDNEESWWEQWSEQFNLSTAISLAGSIVQSIGLVLSKTFLILLTVIFILLEAGTFTKKVKDSFVRSNDMTERAQKIVENIQHYIVIKTWVSLATGVLVVIWLKFLGVSHAPLWGLLAFLFNFVPNVGSFIAAIPAVLIAWLELTTLPAIACAVGFIVVNGAIGNFIEPRLMGKGLGLSPLVVFCSMVFWGWVLGPIGMLLSVPLTMTARIAMDGFEDTRWLATLMGNADS